MAGRGRFGKYGDLKRKEKMRQVRLLRASQSGILPVREKARMPKSTNATEDKKTGFYERE
jgi:hypothetical protein